MVQVSTHTKDDCPLTIISCPYEGMDCNAEVRNSFNRPRETHHLPYDLIFHRGLIRISHCQEEFWRLVFCYIKYSQQLRNEAVKVDSPTSVANRQSLYSINSILPVYGSSHVINDLST